MKIPDWKCYWSQQLQRWKVVPCVCEHRVSCMTVWLLSILQAAGPPKKSKSAAAASGKSKKGAETKEVTETELSVSQTFK